MIFAGYLVHGTGRSFCEDLCCALASICYGDLQDLGVLQHSSDSCGSSCNRLVTGEAPFERVQCENHLWAFNVAYDDHPQKA